MKPSVLLFCLLATAPSFGLAFLDVYAPAAGTVYIEEQNVVIRWNTSGIADSNPLFLAVKPGSKTPVDPVHIMDATPAASTTLFFDSQFTIDLRVVCLDSLYAEIIKDGLPASIGYYHWTARNFEGSRAFEICLSAANNATWQCSGSFTVAPSPTPSSTSVSSCQSCRLGFNPGSIVGIVIGGLASVGVVYGVVKGIRRKASSPGARSSGAQLRRLGLPSLPSYQRTLEDPPPLYIERPPVYTSLPDRSSLDVTDARIERAEQSPRAEQSEQAEQAEQEVRAEHIV